jgi:phosphonoacetate hydrolase
MDSTHHPKKKGRLVGHKSKSNISKNRCISRRQLIKNTGIVVGSLPAICLNLGAKPTGKRLIVILLMDGLDPQYLEKSDIPNLRRLMQEGIFLTVDGVLPSVTNVNNASIVTASFSKSHGITSNYYYDRKTGQEYYMESSDFVLKPTLFEKAQKLGYRTAFLTAKEKLLRLLNKGTDIGISAQNPPAEWIKRVGKPESMYTAEVNYWLFRAFHWVLKNRKADLIYVATTDYMTHTYAPEEEPSQEHLFTLDKMIGQAINDYPEMEFYMTADHGMNAKTEAIDLNKVMKSANIDALAVPIIKDRHVVHHKNMGGASYIYLQNENQLEETLSLLKGLRGVDDVFTKEEAVETFHLHPERIGDIFVLGDRHRVFGNLKKEREQIEIRSHGSRYEATVPLLAYGVNQRKSDFEYNIDVVRQLQL